MMFRVASLVCLLAAVAPAQVVGSALPPAHLFGLSGTTAGSLAELAMGRALLLEFFSYW